MEVTVSTTSAPHLPPDFQGLKVPKWMPGINPAESRPTGDQHVVVNTTIAPIDIMR